MPLKRFLYVIPLLLGVAAIGSAAVPNHTYLVGPQRLYKKPSDVAAMVKDGDIVAIDAGHYEDCAVWRASNLVIEGNGDVVIENKVCQDKGIFVTAGANITIRGIEFAHARSSDKNGAGIRGEGMDLTVDNSRFTDNENGILTGVNTSSHVVIRNSVFTLNGKCDPVCAHGIYIGHVALLQVINSTFLQQNQGHHIKSRALRTEISGTTIKDGPVGTASYLVDIPDGGSLVLRANSLEKGPKAENYLAAVSIGEESKHNPTAELTIDHNVFVSDNPNPTTFIRNLTTTPARLVGNLLTGKVVPLTGPEAR
jgi:parallel beta helix pectate lyase-like protein